MKIMKKVVKIETHPEIYTTKVACTCWASFEMALTVKELKVESCSDCHPFYTWKERSTANAWRVARFRAMQESAEKNKK